MGVDLSKLWWTEWIGMPVDLRRRRFGLVFSLRNIKNICRQVGVSLLVTLKFWELAFIRCNRIQVEPGVTQTFAWVPIYFYLKPALELDFKCSNRPARNIPVSWLFSTCLHSNEGSNGRRWSILRLPHKKDRDPLKILFFLRKIRILSATEDSLTMALISWLFSTASRFKWGLKWPLAQIYSCFMISQWSRPGCTFSKLRRIWSPGLEKLFKTWY